MASQKNVTVVKQEVWRKAAQTSFWDFCEMFWDRVPGSQPLQIGWHMKTIAKELEVVAERVFRGLPKEYNLLINCPPGVSKSSICSILFQPWTWTRMPSARHIIASHTDMLVLDLATKSRAVIESDLYKELFPEIKLRDDQTAKGYFANTLGGDRVSCTVGGKSPMGFHAHFLSLDDPINPQQVLSAAELENAANFAPRVLFTRKVDKKVSVFVGIMQRLHVGDPSGVLLEKAKEEGAEAIRHINLPAELTDKVSPPELTDNYVDGLLDPVRLSHEALKPFKTNRHEYNAQFLQEPFLLGGGLFKIQYFSNRVKAAPYNCKRIRFWDRACLLASTTIHTSKGVIPIEDVKKGDYVLTRKGYKRVLWAGISKWVDEWMTVTFSNGVSLSGTFDHRVWTEGNGWTSIENLGITDCCLYMESDRWRSEEVRRVSPIRKQWNSMESFTHGDQAIVILKEIVGTKKKRNCGRIPCIERCGDSTTEKYQKDTTSITKMVTGTTTLLKTSNASRGVSTTKSTTRSKTGTVRKNPRNIIENSLKEFGVTRNIVKSCVRFAVKLRGLEHYEKEPSALRIVPRERLQAGSDGSALCAKRNTGERKNWDIALPCAAISEKIPVYDLTVEDEPEFFANGILVHNSSSSNSAACFTAGVLMAKDDEGKFYVEHMVHGQWEPDERNQIILATAHRDRTKYGPHHEPQIYIEAEGGSSGRDAWKAIARILAGFPVREERVTGSKDTRAEPWSCILASGNVWLVEDGTWLLNKLIDEHIKFLPEPGKRLGRFKDIVDASTGAFNLLVQQKVMGGITIHNFRKPKQKTIQVVVLSREQLASTTFQDEPALLLTIQDPFATEEELSHGIVRLLDKKQLNIANLDPEHFQETWQEPVEGFNLPPDELIMSRDVGRQLWGFLTKKREITPKLVVICDEDTNRGLAIAYGVTDTLRLPRKETIQVLSTSDTSSVWEKGSPNKYLTQMVKLVKDYRETVV